MDVPNWLSAEDYQRVRDWVPIACVDVAALRMDERGAAQAVGLILRDTPHQGRRWCMVGGRIVRNETLAQAAERHLRQTLGEHVRFEIELDAQPIYVSQYFTTSRAVGVVDPRQHSVAMNYCIAIGGSIAARGEAHEFRWFGRGELPLPEQFGFGQDRVLGECLKRAGIWR